MTSLWAITKRWIECGQALAALMPDDRFTLLESSGRALIGARCPAARKIPAGTRLAIRNRYL